MKCPLCKDKMAEERDEEGKLKDTFYCSECKCRVKKDYITWTYRQRAESTIKDIKFQCDVVVHRIKEERLWDALHRLRFAIGSNLSLDKTNYKIKSVLRKEIENSTRLIELTKDIVLEAFIKKYTVERIISDLIDREGRADLNFYTLDIGGENDDTF